MKKVFISTVLIFAAFLFHGQKDTTEIYILHTNDMHSKIDNYDKFASVVKDFKNKYENVFVISAGDLFTGNPINDQYKPKGWPIVHLMNTIRYDLSCIGNHEFDYGQKELNYLTQNADFPFICANIHTGENTELDSKKDYMKLYTENNISLGFLGLIEIGENNLPSTNPANLINISFSDPIETAAKYKSYKDSSDIFIALTHLGFDTDTVLAGKYPFFDVIIGGHSHTKLDNGILKNDVLITQAGSYLEYAGVLTLKYCNGELVSKKDTLISLYNFPESDPEIKALIDGYNNNPKYKEILGKCKNDITGKDELGAFITDAMADTLLTDISFVNIGGIRSRKIKAGDITLKQVYELSPFCNTYIIYELKPKEIKELFRYTFTFFNNNELQVNGLNVDLIVKGNKLKKVILKDSEGKKLANRKYSVGVNNYMAASYKLDFFQNGKKTNIIDSESLVKFLKKKKEIDYKGVKRVNTIYKD